MSLWGAMIIELNFVIDDSPDGITPITSYIIIKYYFVFINEKIVNNNT